MADDNMRVFHHLHVIFVDDNVVLGDLCQPPAAIAAPAERHCAALMRRLDRRQNVR